MLTIYVQGGGQNRITIPVVLEALINPTKDVVPEETIISRGVSSVEKNEQNDFMMTSSQDLAVAAALTELDEDFTEWLTVAEFSTDTNEKALEPKDRLLKFEGKEITSLKELKSDLNSHGAEPATLTVGRPDKHGVYSNTDVTVNTTEAENGDRQLGVYLGAEYQFPIDVSFGLENVGGPSAGMMFALGDH